jgi:drug/metabolite transporter (DMT)-like permease
MTTIYTCQKQLPLSMVSIFLNLSPVATVLAGGIFIPSEKLTWSVLAQVMLSFAGALMIVLG